MKISRWLISGALLLLFAPFVAGAQASAASDASETAKKEAAPIPLKLQIVLSEYDGAKKVGSLPYSIPFVATSGASSGKPGGAYSSMRFGVRVPVATSAKSSESAVQYIDVGTSLDVRAARADDGRFWVDLTVERSSLYIQAGGVGKYIGKEWSYGDAPPGNQPQLREYRGSVGLFVRDGQTEEATATTDPLTGHVLKVEVTLNVVK
jgi:hypothetical protein